jgi:hypothetical protein
MLKIFNGWGGQKYCNGYILHLSLNIDLGTVLPQKDGQTLQNG